MLTKITKVLLYVDDWDRRNSVFQFGYFNYLRNYSSVRILMLILEATSAWLQDVECAGVDEATIYFVSLCTLAVFTLN